MYAHVHPPTNCPSLYLLFQWHAAVVLAAWVHYCAVLVLLAWRDASGGCAVPASVNGPVAKVLGALHDAGNPPLAGMDGLNAALSAYAVRRASL
jgi:hypothetical protein